MEILFSSAALELHVALLREMADSLNQSQAALLSSDLAGFESHTERQRVLCRQWSALGSPIPTFASVGAEANPFSPDLTDAVIQLRDGLRAYAALLRRARRTTGIFCRVLATAGATYVVPSGERNIAKL